MFFLNPRKKILQSGPGGVYPVNDGDPRNDVPEIDNEDFVENEEDFLAGYGYERIEK
jgi:hypothetical protein